MKAVALISLCCMLGLLAVTAMGRVTSHIPIVDDVCSYLYGPPSSIVCPYCKQEARHAYNQIYNCQNGHVMEWYPECKDKQPR